MTTDLISAPHDPAAAHAGQAGANADAIDVTTLFGGIARSLPRILLSSVVAGGLAFGALSLIAPRYTSEAQLAIVPKDAGSDPAIDVAVRLDKEAVNTHVRALMSPDLAARIAKDMTLDTRAEFNGRVGSPDAMTAILSYVGLAGPRADESPQDAVQATYFRQLEVYAARESRLIGIKVTSIDPGLAADLANRIAETYRDDLAAQSATARAATEDYLKPRVAALAEEALAAEREADAFRGKADIFKGGTQNTGLKEQELADLTAELARVKASRSELEARAQQARELVAASSSEALTEAQRSPLIQSLVQARVNVERTLSELSATLLPGHPRMRQLAADLAGLKKQIAVEVGKFAASFDKDVKVASLREASLQATIADLKSRVVTAGSDNATLHALELTTQTKRAELEKLQARFESNRVRSTAASQPVEVRIITKARAASVPAFPRMGATCALTGFATLLFGLAWSITRGLTFGARPASRTQQKSAKPVTVRREPKPGRAPDSLRAGPEFAQASAALHTPQAMPSPVPPSRFALAATAGLMAHASDSFAFAPAFEAAPPPAVAAFKTYRSTHDLADAMPRARPGAAGVRTLLAAAPGDAEPVTEATALAESLAMDCATILVAWSRDVADLDGGPGLAELIDGRATFEAVIRPVPGSVHHTLSAGQPLPGADDPSPDEINLVLDALDEAYGQIVVYGRFEPARALFEAIEGRFDVGVLVEGSGTGSGDEVGSFLGFEVADLLIARLERTANDRQNLMARAGIGSRVGRARATA